MSIPPSGRQYEIRYGEQVAVVVEVGRGVREYRVGDRAVVDPYPREAMCDGAHGTVLVPWPNRLAEGRYRFDGLDYQVAITEPDKGNAIHGLLRWRGWEAVRQESNRVTMGIRLYPLTGYPFLLDVTVDYVLDGEGLTVTTTATNRGERTCPYGCGQHPYLSPGDGLIDDAVLRFAAGTRIVTDPQRQLPTGTEPVAGGRCDFSQGRRLGDQRIDFAFTDLARDDAGRAWVRLEGPDGRRAELWVDQTYPIVELFTGDTLSPHRRRRGLGTEPMTCPPNAFQSGEGVRHLGPGQAVTTRWGARLDTG
jgi:aldose 1-epimerase